MSLQGIFDPMVKAHFKNKYGGGGEADHSMEDGRITGAITDYRNDRVESVAGYAFHYDHILRTITLPNVKTVGEKAFLGASKLKIVDLPTLTSASDGAFNINSSNVLKYVVIRSETMASCEYAFSSNATHNFLVPRALIEAYEEQLGYYGPIGSNHTDVSVRAIEDYTVDGTITGELDLTKMGL